MHKVNGKSDFRWVSFIVFLGLVLISQKEIRAVGLGQAHWIGGPFMGNSEIKFGYSSSTEWDLSRGDSWAAIEPEEGKYNWKQIDDEIEAARSRGKKVWLQIQTSDQTNKEHNVPNWLNKRISMYTTTCGKDSIKRLLSATDLNNSNLIDKSETSIVRTNNQDYVKIPVKIPAIWDPLYREKFSKVLEAMAKRYMNNPTVEAFNMMLGKYGEMVAGYACPFYDKTCTPDVLNKNCPAIQSMAKVTNRSVDVIASRSDCKKNVCTGGSCPIEYQSSCYVFEDYYIEAVKDMIDRYRRIFTSKPVVLQDGSGLSGNARVTKTIKDWAIAKYGDKVWFKFNGWGPTGSNFMSRKFELYYGSKTRHGYEPMHPDKFSRNYWKYNGGDEAAKKAIKNAIKEGIVNDKSSYLTMQSTFFDTKTDFKDRGNGKWGNQYYFNPNDNTPNCDKSEIRVEYVGDVGWCPGFLNATMARNYKLALYQSPSSLVEKPSKGSIWTLWKDLWARIIE